MRLIAHIYIHNFFVTAASANDSGLAGMPVAVIKKNRVIDTSLEAGARGVIPGSLKRHAVQTCPELNLVEYKSHIYKERSAELAGQCYNLSPRVEICNENEAFIDLSGNRPPKIQMLRGFADGVIPYLGTSATIALAPNRLLAKAATLALASHYHEALAFPGLITKTYNKFRLCVVKAETAGKFAALLPVEMMWPLENNIIKRLKSLGLRTFDDINGIPPTMLRRQFGALASMITDYSRGKDESRVPVFNVGTVSGISPAGGKLNANSPAQLTFFADPKTLNGQAADHKAKLNRVCENLAAKYDPGVITMGNALPISRREQVLMYFDPLRKLK